MRSVQESDFPYLWAAYRMGLWREIMDDELSQDGFREKVLDLISLSDYDWIIEARQSEGTRPVGIVLAAALSDGRRIEPHVDWFPWVTPRNRFEGLAAFLKEVSKRFKILVYAEEAERGFWERLKWYGLVRHGCKIIDHFARGEHSFFFYTAGPE